ncbi:MAG TPA: methylenetetrahydrofolate reductase [NAD(P)H] [Mesorhizobium sp.]|jgi:methylenetetrahydrofolate reductase (NADPH)|nr:methylenetetrahydrofolate reductase [NAD(P)H] [Mesorhizobium sp.]
MTSPYRLSRQPEIGRRLRVSFEFFPPKNEEGEAKLWSALRRLEPLGPRFVSVTYGAGGSTRQRTLETVARIGLETRLRPAAHLTCVDATREEVDAVIAELVALGVTRVVALRGDPQAGLGARYRPHPSGYGSAAELVGALSRAGVADISVSAYPEKHPESPDFAADIEMLKRKTDAGATRAITQFFFENDLFERYVERVRRSGVLIPIVPGILPIHSFRQMASFAGRCGAHVPAWLAERFRGLENDPETHSLVAAAIASEQVMDLVERGVGDFHFYTMNRADLTFAVCHMLGLGHSPEAGTVHDAAA